MEIKPGIYRHYKGNLYRIHHTVKNSEDWENGDMILYEALYDTPLENKFMVRPAHMFTESLEWEGKIVPRFVWVGENPSVKNRPRVGLGVIVVKDGKILVGKRKGGHGDGTWHFTGGHLEFNETWEDCAKRETLEEAGITIKNVRFVTATNDIFPGEQKHYVTIFVIADYDFGEPQIMEPEKCEGWGWYTWDDLPRPLFLTIEHLIQTGFCP